jgi:HlyD family secretion protein
MTMRANLRRTLIWVAIGTALAGGIAWSFRPQPVAVDLAAVTQGPMRVGVADEGRTRVRESYTVSAPIAGRLLRVVLRPGDIVEGANTIVAELQPSDPAFLDIRARNQAEATVRAAVAARGIAASAVTEAQAAEAHTARELQRVEALAARDLVSRVELETARLAQRQAAAHVEGARQALRMKESELEVARALTIEFGAGAGDERLPLVMVRAPVRGRVLRVLQKSEGVVPAGTPIVEIGNPDELEVVVDLLSPDAVKVREGAAARIVDWGGPVPLAARVRRVEPSGFTRISALGVEEQRVSIILDILEARETWRALGDGFRVTADITIWQTDDAVLVPQSALFRDGEEWAVFAARAGRASHAAVSIGQMNDLEAQVLEGLEPGEQVIVHPSDRVRDGVAILPRGQ